jgi:hypothetical protein
MLYSRKVTVEQVLLVFIGRAIQVGLEYNLIAGVLFEEALQTAK